MKKESRNSTPNKNSSRKNSQNQTQQSIEIIRINCIDNIPSSIEHIFTLSSLNIIQLKYGQLILGFN